MSDRQRTQSQPCSTGKRKGDSFTLRDHPLPKRTASVLQVLSKYAYRFAFCRDELETRFPNQGGLWAIHIPKKDGQPDFDRFEQIDRRSKHIEGVLKWYSDNPVPLFMLAEQTGRPIFRMREFIAVSDGLAVRCALGTEAERARAEQALQLIDTVAIDMPALSTLFHLRCYGAADILSWFTQCPWRVCVAEAAITELRQLIGEYRAGKEKGYIGKKDGQYFLHEPSAGELESVGTDLERFVGDLESVFSVVPSDLSGPLDFALRQRLLPFVGRVGVETLAIGTRERCTVWTDDVMFGQVVESEVGVSRVWTEVLAYSLAAKGLIRNEDLEEVRVRLTQMNYDFVPITVQTLSRAGELSDWDAGIRPFSKAIERLADRNGVEIIAGFLSDLWLKGPLDERKYDVLIRILGRIDARPNGRRRLISLAGRVNDAFGVNAIGAQQVRGAIEIWAQSNPRIVLP